MAGFFSALLAETGARRRRLRLALGDRGQSIAEFLIMSGLALGSLGLFVRPWMADAAPWGFALPFVFLIGYVALDFRRQAELARGGEAERVSTRHDWIVLLWSFGCALAGAAAFVIAWGAEPPRPPEQIWTPPESAVSVDMSP